MPQHLTNIRIDVNEKIFLKDPYTSELGRSILIKGLPLIETLGMEGFTFKKLAAEIETTESAVYRYFENKHKLLLYYVSWYWGWMEYNLAFGTANLASPEERLRAAIKIIVGAEHAVKPAPFDMMLLRKVIISESSKAFFTKEVDNENKEGLFAQFKSLCGRLAGLITDFAPNFPYSATVASMFIESFFDQLFFAEHLPSLTDLGKDEACKVKFYELMIFSTIDKWKA